MRKNKLFFILAVLAAAVLSACGQARPAEGGSSASSRLKIVTAIYPEYDWVKQILGSHFDEADVVLLMSNGADLHSYQPTADDIMNIADCDIFIYGGGESDAWVKAALEQQVSRERAVISLLDVLKEDLKNEEITEGMEHDHEEEEESEADEHVWLSLRLAEKAVDAICGVIADKAPALAADCRNNAEAYCAKLAELDEAYASMVSSAPVNTVLFGDRFPFRYLCDDYGLKYYAAFTGCSAETEASFETVIFLAEKTDELKLPAILTIEGSDRRLAETIRENTKEKNQEILTMDSMQKTGAQEAENTSYLAVMEHNYEVLGKALNRE